jgi:hypothetical protein
MIRKMINRYAIPIVILMAYTAGTVVRSYGTPTSVSRKVEEAALVERATDHCKTLAHNLRPICRDAFVKGATEKARVIKSGM